MNRLLTYAFTCFGFVVTYTCIRILFFVFIGEVNMYLDRYFFSLSFFLILLSTSAALKMIFQLTKQSGQKLKYELFVRTFYLVISIVASSINIFFSYSTKPDELGFYMIQVNINLSFVITVLYIPVLFIAYFQTKSIQKRIKDKSFRNQVLIFGILFVMVPVINFIYIASYWILPNFTLLTIVYFVFMLGILIIGVMFFFNYPEFLDSFATYFSVKSVFVIKDGGQMLYGHDFLDVEKDYFSSKELLMGGFVHAISSGLEVSLNSEEKVKTIDLGKIKLIIKHGKYVFAVLSSSEVTESLNNKLEDFLDRFETK